MTTERRTHGYCPKCREPSAVDGAGDCLWCGTPTEPERPRRGGWKRPDLVGSRYTEAQLRALHLFHMRDGLSLNEMARRTYEIAGYKTHGSAATAISREWKRLGLKARDRIEATVRASTRHGRKSRSISRTAERDYRRWLARRRGWRAQRGPGQPRCEGVRQKHPGKGEPCCRPAMSGSRFCAAHDLERTAQRIAHLDQVHAQTRDRLAASALPMAPFAAFVARRWRELGSLRAAGEQLGLSPTAVSAYARGLGTDKRPKATIQRSTVERVLEADGTTSFGELYGPRKMSRPSEKQPAGAVSEQEDKRWEGQARSAPAHSPITVPSGSGAD